MAVLGEENRVKSACVGATNYPLGSGFLFHEETDLVVIRTDVDGVESTLVLTTDYTVNGGDGATGSIDTVATYSDGFITIYRDTAAIQSYDAEVGDGFNTNTWERNLDRLAMVCQEVLRDLKRCFRLSSQDEELAALPGPTERAGKYLAFDDDGDPIVTTSPEASWAQEWAIQPEDTLVSTQAGGDGSTDYSALHHAAKAAASNSEAEEWASQVEDTEITGHPGEYSALHWAAKAAASAAAAKGLISFDVFTANGTWTKPTGASEVHVITVGGGGAGGPAPAVGSSQAGAGGGGGGFGYHIIPAGDCGATEAVSIGAGGNGAAGAPGGNGGSTTFGSLATGFGGAGAGYPSTPFYLGGGGGAGASGSYVEYEVAGEAGAAGMTFGDVEGLILGGHIYARGGKGGNAAYGFGPGGPEGYAYSTGATVANQGDDAPSHSHGGGGGGACSSVHGGTPPSAVRGGHGGDGICIVMVF